MKRVRRSHVVSAGNSPISFMLDSGAFSAWRRGQTILVKDYIDFATQYEDVFDSIVSLDVIPGDHGEARTAKQVRAAIEESKQNHFEMKSAGLSPIPVFHQDEPFDYLEWLVDQGEPYIGISPSGDRAAMSIAWFDDVFRILTDCEGYPVVKTHGFGVTTPKILHRYPWYSVDSLAWSIKAGFGYVCIPKCVDGKPSYAENPFSVSLSGVRAASTRSDYQDFVVCKVADGCGGIAAKHVQDFLVDVVGTTLTRARESPYVRMRVLVHYFKELSRVLVYAPFDRSGSLSYTASTKDRVVWDHKRLIFASGSFDDPRRHKVLNDLNISDRLVSFYDLRNMSEKSVREFAKSGLPRTPSSQCAKVSFRSKSYWSHRKIKFADMMDRRASQAQEPTDE